MWGKLTGLAAVFAILVAICKADTPANCTYDDIVGTWTFYEGDRGKGWHIDCSKFAQSQSKQQFTYRLLFPDIAVDQFGNEGFWSLIYNQGFEVQINKRSYFAFSNWKVDEDGKKKVTSLCHETKAGWSHDALVRDWSCYVAKQVTNGEDVRPKQHVEPMLWTTDQMDQLKQQKYQTNRGMISKVNNMQKSWHAGPVVEWEDKSLYDIFHQLGGPRSRVTKIAKTKLAKHTEFSQMLGHLQNNFKSLPAEFDWRAVNGQNFVSPVRNQGACGSCYAFASAAMFESRLRIATNNTVKLTFSPQDVVECSEYSQGCKGGFAYLIAGKYAQDFGMVLEECNPYSSPSTVHSCRTARKCRRYYATDYKYVGGYFGADNEPLMRAALVQNGPLAVGFEVYEDFMAYRKGVYHHTHVKDTVNNWHRMLGITRHNKWDPLEMTNHAVLIVGYGSDKKTGESYWLVKNSWGTEWGENGYFRIRRGTDECSIESMAMEATPIPTY